MTTLDWKKVDLLKELSFIKGKAPKRLFDDYEHGTLPYLTPEYLRGNVPVDSFCSASGSIEVNDGDLVLLWDGSNAGEVFKARNGALASTMSHLVFDTNKIDAEFFFYFLKAHEAKIKSQVRGSGVPHVDKQIIGELPNEFPANKVEQHKIAEILSTLDEAIWHTEALIRKQERVKQGLISDLLTRGVVENGEIRDPIQTPELFHKDVFGIFPKDWIITSLGKIISRAKGIIQTGPFGTQLHAYDYVEDGIPTIMPQDIDETGWIEYESLARLTHQKALQLKRHVLQKNDVILARRGELSKCSTIGIREQGWICGTDFMLARVPAAFMNGKWFAHYYRNDICQRQVLAQAVGSTMKGINTNLLYNLIIALPGIEEQLRIINIIDLHESLIKIEKLQQNKLLN